MKLFRLAALALSAFAILLPVQAQNWPSRPVRFIVPTAPGGPTDAVGRVVAQELSLLWKQPVLVDNRAGASSTIGTHLVAQAPADGYTLLVAFLSHVTNPSLFAKLPYDPKADFAPIAKMVDMASVIVVQPSFPANNLKEFVDYVRAHPNKVAWAIGSIGSSEHLAGGMLASRAGIKFLPVPYQGAGPAMRDLLGGHADFKVESVGNALPLLKAGKLKAIAVTTEKRSALLPDVPSIAESGYPRFGITAFVSLVAPAKTPAAILEKISTDTATVLARPDVIEKLLGVGATVDALPPEQFTAFINAQMADFDTVITEMGLKGTN